MAARRASVQFLGALQRSSVRSFQPVVVPRQGAVATFSQGRDVNEHVARSTYGGFFGNRQLHKESQAAEVSQRGEKVAEEAKGKASEVAGEAKGKASEVAGEAKGKASEVASEGSAKVDQAKETVKEKTSEAADKASEVADEGKGQVSKNVDTAKDMFKDLPQKVSETATGLKEVGVEAGKAVKRDASKIVQKVGLKTDED